MFQIKYYRIEDSQETLDTLLKVYPNKDTVIATNDVFGYDNSSFFDLVYSGLTTIYHPAYDIGYVGAKLLCQLIQQKAVKKKVGQLPVQLVMRKSLRKKVMNQITVLGFISTDFVETTDILPKIRETVSGIDFNQSFGGNCQTRQLQQRV